MMIGRARSVPIMPIAMTRAHFVFFFQAMVGIACAQGDELQVPLLADGLVSYGTVVQRSSAFGLSDWRTILPGSAILKEEMPSGDWGRYYGGYSNSFDPYAPIHYGTGSVYLAVSLDMQRGASEATRFVKRLRIGLNSAGYDDAYGSWGRSLSGVYDTLVSQQTGHMIYLDSTWDETYTAYMTRSHMALDASYIMRKASPRRMTWYCGVGAMLGITYEGTADVSHRVTRYREGVSGNTSQIEQTLIASEQFRLRPTFFGAVDVLFGLDFTLGRASPFWSSLHLIAESRAMLHIGSYPGSPARLDEASQHLFGVRFDLR